MQPRAHHRAHYETEGSRGAVKAAPGGHPVVKVRGRGQARCSLSPPTPDSCKRASAAHRIMALPFPTLCLSCDPAGSLGEGLELRKEGYTARTRICFLLFFSVLPHPTLPDSPRGTSASCLLWKMVTCQMWGRVSAEAKGYWELGFSSILSWASLSWKLFLLCPAQFGPSKNNTVNFRPHFLYD